MREEERDHTGRMTVGQALLIVGLLVIGGLTIQRGYTLFGLVVVMGVFALALNVLFRWVLAWAMRDEYKRKP